MVKLVQAAATPWEHHSQPLPTMMTSLDATLPEAACCLHHISHTHRLTTSRPHEPCSCHPLSPRVSTLLLAVTVSYTHTSPASPTPCPGGVLRLCRALPCPHALQQQLVRPPCCPAQLAARGHRNPS